MPDHGVKSKENMNSQEFRADDNLLQVAVDFATNGKKLTEMQYRRVAMAIVLDVRNIAVNAAARVEALENARSLDLTTWRKDLEKSPLLHPKRWHFAVSLGAFFGLTYLAHLAFSSGVEINIQSLLNLFW